MASASGKPLQSSESAYFEAMQMLTEEFSNISQTMDELKGRVKNAQKTIANALRDMRKQMSNKEKALDRARSTGKSGGAKKVRPEGKPKRPMTAYLLWSRDNRERVKANMRAEAGVDPKNKDVVSRCAQEWNALSDGDKAPYVAEFVRLQEEYRKAMAIFEATQSTGGTPAGDDEEEADMDSDDSGPSHPGTHPTVSVLPLPTTLPHGLPMAGAKRVAGPMSTDDEKGDKAMKKAKKEKKSKKSKKHEY